MSAHSQQTVEAPFCKVLQCRYSSTHTTKGHCCGRCNNYGHGEIECLQPWRKLHLQEYYNDILPNEKNCTVADCNHKEHHTSSAHHCPNCQLRCTHTLAECPLQTSSYSQLSASVYVPLKLIKCPICRAESRMKDPKKILGLSDKCSICLDNNVEILLTECYHCCVCKDCYDRM